MPAERALLPRDIRYILDWYEKWQAIPTMKQIARELRVSEATVSRIARTGGYPHKKKNRDVEALAASIERNLSVPHGTERNTSLQEINP